ncbi:hypothetical protein ABFX02_06G064300 [Erythranthe guttata]
MASKLGEEQKLHSNESGDEMASKLVEEQKLHTNEPDDEMASKLAEEQKLHVNKSDDEMASKLTEEEKLHANESDDEADIEDDLSTAVKLMYDRDIPGHKPENLEYCKPFVDLAIDSYNKKHSTHYRVVELVRAIGCVCAGYYFFMKFTATDSDTDPDAATKTFAADIFDGISETKIDYVDIVAEGASLQVDTVPCHYF